LIDIYTYMICIICKAETENRLCLECMQLVNVLTYGNSVRQDAWNRLERRLTGEGEVKCG